MFHAKLRWASCAYGLSSRPVPVVRLNVLCLWCAFTASYTSCAYGVPAQRVTRPVPVVCLHSELYVLCLWCACTASYTSCACGVLAQRALTQSVWIGFKADTPRCTHTHFTGAVM